MGDRLHCRERHAYQGHLVARVAMVPLPTMRLQASTLVGLEVVRMALASPGSGSGTAASGRLDLGLDLDGTAAPSSPEYPTAARRLGLGADKGIECMIIGEAPGRFEESKAPPEPEPEPESPEEPERCCAAGPSADCPGFLTLCRCNHTVCHRHRIVGRRGERTRWWECPCCTGRHG